jgi:hypothetical protein
MMQNKTGASLSMGRIPQLFGHAVLAAGVLTGGASLLNAGGAIASCPPPGPTFSNNGFYSTTLTNNAATHPGTCSIESPFAGNPFFDNVVAIEYDFAPNNINNTSGVYQYSVTSSVGAFTDYRLDFDTQLGSTSAVTKEIFSDSSFSNLIGTVNENELTILKPLTNQSLTTIWVRDTYSAQSGDVLDTVTNTFQTPGPLPILGAGAAFGFSRKLRGRIKAARLG